jgi:DNA-binding transcriptional regulator YiaG
MNCETNVRHFVRGGGDAIAEPYEYAESGLKGVFLHNGFTRHMLGDEEFVAITDTAGLHRAIGRTLVLNQKALAGDEVRFLRKEMDLTQAGLGGLMGYSSQQIARWEKSESAIAEPANRLLRAVYLLKTMAPEERADFLQILQEVEGMDELTPRRVIKLQFSDNSWEGRVRRAL